DAEQPGQIPSAQAIDRNRQQVYLLPVLQLGDAIGKKRRYPRDLGAERRQAVAPNPVEAALANHEGALPVLAAIDEQENPAELDAAERIAGVGGAPRKPH